MDGFSIEDMNVTSASNPLGLFFNEAEEHSYSRRMQNQKRDRIDKM